MIELCRYNTISQENYIFHLTILFCYKYLDEL